MMTRKNFQAVADKVKAHVDFLNDHPANAAGFDDGYHTGYRYGVEVLADDLADIFAADNTNFDREKFLTACGL